MALHQFIAQENAEELIPDHIRARITPEKLTEVYRGYCLGRWYPEQIRSQIEELITSGHYSNMPESHAAVMAQMEEDPKTLSWKIGDSNKEEVRTEPLMENDIIHTAGFLAAEVLTPDEFWDTLPGFSGPSDMHGTIGTLLMKNRDLFSYYNCYTWDSEYKEKKYRTRVTGDKDLDLRVERICVTTAPTVDPFGAPVHYQPLTGHEKKTLFAASNAETNLMAAIFKYVDQEQIDVPCLADQGKTLIEEMKEGANIGRTWGLDVGHVLSSFAYPLGGLDNRLSIFWTLPKEFHGSYRIHLDDQRNLAFTNTNKGTPIGDISMTIPPEEIDQLIRALFMQSRKSRGRTSLATLEAMFTERYSQEFADRVEKDKKNLPSVE